MKKFLILKMRNYQKLLIYLHLKILSKNKKQKKNENELEYNKLLKRFNKEDPNLSSLTYFQFYEYDLSEKKQKIIQIF